MIISFCAIIIICFLILKKYILSKIASIIYRILGLIHFLYTLVIQIIEIINKDKDVWKKSYFENHIYLYLLILSIIIGIIRIFSFKKFNIYISKIKNLEKFLINEEKDFFFDSLNEKLNYQESFDG